MLGLRCEAVQNAISRAPLIVAVLLFLPMLSPVGLAAEKEGAPADQKASETAAAAKRHREEAVQHVKEFLKSKNPEDIEIGAKIIVSEELREFRKDLASIAVENKDKEARRIAILALLRLEDTDVAEDDRKELSEARTRVFDALKATGVLSIQAIGEVKRYRLMEFVEELEKTAREGAGDVRRDAVRALALLARQDVEPFLEDMRKKAQQEVGAREFAAAWAEEMKRLKENEKDVARKLLEGTPEEKVSAVGDVQLAHLDGCLPIVRKLAATDPKVSFHAFCLLDDWKGTPADEEANMECFREASKSQNPYIRNMGAFRLAKRGRREGVECLIALLESEDANMRAGAIISLGAAVGTTLSYDPFADATQRAKAVKEWRDWLEKNKARFK